MMFSGFLPLFSVLLCGAVQDTKGCFPTEREHNESTMKELTLVSGCYLFQYCQSYEEHLDLHVRATKGEQDDVEFD